MLPVYFAEEEATVRSSTRFQTRRMDLQPLWTWSSNVFRLTAHGKLNQPGGDNIHKSANGYEGDRSIHQRALRHPEGPSCYLLGL